MHVEQATLSKGSELRCPSPQLADSHRLSPASPLASLRLWYSHTHQSPAHLNCVLMSPLCSSDTKHLLPWCTAAHFPDIFGTRVGLHLLPKEASSKGPSVIQGEPGCTRGLSRMKRTCCVSFMVLTINSLTLQLLIYVTAGKSLTTSPKAVTNEIQSYTKSTQRTGEEVQLRGAQNLQRS